jgi:hypothetical protein
MTPKQNEVEKEPAMPHDPEKLLARIKELEEERDAYRGALNVLFRNENITFTKEELEDLRTNGIPFEKVVEEVKEMLDELHREAAQGAPS